MLYNLGLDTVSLTVIEVITLVLTGTVETSIPTVEVGHADTVSLGEITTPRVTGGDSGVLGTGRDNVSNSVRGSIGRSRTPVISRLGLSLLGGSRLLSGGSLLGSLLGGLLGGLLGLSSGDLLLGEL